MALRKRESHILYFIITNIFLGFFFLYY